MKSNFYTNFHEAKAAFDAVENLSHIAFCDFGMATENGVKGWLVRWEVAAGTLTHTGKKLVVTLANGATAVRGTENEYRAAVVGMDSKGKLLVLSAHWDESGARAALDTFKAGKFVNFNYRKLVGEPTLVTA
jgi:hypothetical protein